jgi:UDP-glucose 4-epimerase
MDIADRSFLITGGGSLIGSHVAERLLSRGAARVVLFDNLSLGSLANVAGVLDDPRVAFVRGDVLRPSMLLEALEGIDGAFSMAALLTLPMSRDPSLGLSVNIDGVINTLDGCRFQGVEKLVLASSIAVYGDQIEDRVAESTPFGSASLAPPFVLYALSKLAGEQLGRFYALNHGVDFSAVRYSTVYGERQHDRGVNALAIVDAYRSVRAGTPPVIVGDGTEAHDYLHVADAANATVEAMVAGRSGEAYTIATGRSTSVREIVEIVIRTAGGRLEPEFREDDRPHRATQHSHLDLDVSKAREHLAWSAQVSVEEGIGRLLAWLDEQDSDGRAREASPPTSARAT